MLESAAERPWSHIATKAELDLVTGGHSFASRRLETAARRVQPKLPKPVKLLKLGERWSSSAASIEAVANPAQTAVHANRQPTLAAQSPRAHQQLASRLVPVPRECGRDNKNSELGTASKQVATWRWMAPAGGTAQSISGSVDTRPPRPTHRPRRSAFLDQMPSQSGPTGVSTALYMHISTALWDGRLGTRAHVRKVSSKSG